MIDSDEVTRQTMNKEESASARDLSDDKEEWDSFIHLPSEDITANKPFGTDLTEQVEKYQEICKSLESDCVSLELSRRTSKQDESRLQGEIQILRRRLEQQDMNTKAEKEASQQILDLERKKTEDLLAEKQALENELKELERLLIEQEKCYKVPDTLPDMDMVFKGHVEELMNETVSDMLTVLPQVRYPVPAGSALINFENPEVAKKIAAMKQHKVKLDEGSFVYVTAELIEFILPSSLEISLERIPHQVVVSGLETSSASEEQLCDKLELFFSKRKNGGGEVDSVERLSNLGQLLLTFVEDEVTKQLVQIGQFQVPIGNKTHTVKLSYYTTGKLADLQVCRSVCARTVLLSGIPDVLEEELMRDALESHFQKPSKGGGEIGSRNVIFTNFLGAIVKRACCFSPEERVPVGFLSRFETMSSCCTVRVRGLPTDLPPERVSDKLMIHFLRARNGGGEIVHTEFLPESPGCAMVTFEDAAVTQQVLRAEKHVLFVNGKEYPLEVTAYSAEVNPNEVFVYVCMKIDYGRFPDGKDILWKLRKQYTGVQFSFNLQAMTCSVKGSFSELQAFSSELLSCFKSKQKGISTTKNGEATHQKVLETQEEKEKNGRGDAGRPVPLGNPMGSREEPLEDFSLVIDSDVHLYMQRFCLKEFNSILYRHQVGVVDVSNDGVTTLYLQAAPDETGGMGALVSAHLAISEFSQQLELTLRKEKISKRDLGASACRGLPEKLQSLCPLLLCHEDDRHFYLIGNLLEVSQAKQYIQNLIATRVKDHQKPVSSQQLSLIQDKSDVLGQIKSLEESVPRKPSSPKFTGKSECKLAAKFGSSPSLPSQNAPLERQLPRTLSQTADYQISESQRFLEVVATANKSEIQLKQPVEFQKAPDRMKADPFLPTAVSTVPSSVGCSSLSLVHSLPSHVASSTLRSLNLFDTTGTMDLKVSECRPLLRRCSSSLFLKPPNSTESLPVDKVSIGHSQQKNTHSPLQKEIGKEEVAQMEREVRSLKTEERTASSSSLTVPKDSGMERTETLATHPDYICENYSYSELAVDGPEDETLTDLCKYLKKCCDQVLISQDKYKLDITYPRDVKLQVLEAFRCFSDKRVAALAKQLLSCDLQQGKIQDEISTAKIQRNPQQLKASSKASLQDNPLPLGSLAREGSTSQVQRPLDFSSLQPAMAQNFPNDWKAWQTKSLDKVPDSSKQSRPGKSIVEVKCGLPDKFHFGRDWNKERCGREVEGTLSSLPAMPLSVSAPVQAQIVGKRSPPAGKGDTPDVNLRTASPGSESKAGACELCCSTHAATYHTSCGCTLCKACFSTSDVAPSCSRASPALLGAFAVTTISQNLPGYFRDPTLKLTYDIPDGVQQAGDPRPGYPYRGGHFEAFLPDNPEGQRLMVLLHKAFERGLTFQIRTCGTEEWVTWGLIPHKTSMEGGKSRNGYPDAQYLRQLSQKLEELGIK